jgi:hypothetical protein
MAHYFFHLREGVSLQRDIEGASFPTLDLAREEAAHAARELLARRVLNSEPIGRQIFEIADDTGRVLEEFPLSSVLRLE